MWCPIRLISRCIHRIRIKVHLRELNPVQLTARAECSFAVADWEGPQLKLASLPRIQQIQACLMWGLLNGHTGLVDYLPALGVLDHATHV